MRRLSLFIASFLLLISFVFIGYHLVFAKRIIPGVWVGNLNLGGKSLAEVSRLLTPIWGDASEKQLVFVAPDGDKTEVSLASLGVVFDLPASLKNAYSAGRSGNFFADLSRKVTALWRGVYLSPVYSLDKDIFASELNRLFLNQEQDFQEARFILSDTGEIVFQEGKEGKVLSVDAMANCVRQQIEYANRASWRCAVLTTIKKPQYTEKDLSLAKAQLEKIKDLRIAISWDEGDEILSSSKVIGLLAMDPDGLSVDLTRVIAYARELAKLVDYPATNASFIVQDDGKLARFTPAKAGLRLNQELFVEQLASLLDRALVQGELSLTLSAPTTALLPEIASVDNQYGIKDLLGEGKSVYHGSSANRIYNLKLASQRLNGRLIAPGETVSFNNLLGEVSAQSGYRSSYVIVGNQTILGAGGGVCQTSTTLFRATLDAGLPILERTAHLYRVHYYEPPLGMDATVMAPYTDFVFQNDTPAYILIQTSVDEEKEELSYQIFGADDGRETVISEPVVTNQTGYPPPIYQDDPNLPKGKVVQVEWASAGATATVARKVVRAGEVLQDDLFVSRYKPWASVFLVGTKE